MLIPVFHISLPKLFTSVNVAEWFQRYKICCCVNVWDEEEKALKLPTFLEGKALVVCTELTKEQLKDYTIPKLRSLMSSCQCGLFH